MWPAGAVLALDQATKLWALAFLAPGFAKPVLPGLNWTLVFNRGIAFSAFNNDARWQPWVFASLAAGVAVAIAILLVRTEKRPSLNGFGLALILAGALGNFVDRVRFGYVVDFIDCYYSVWHWPAFNVADSAITTGGALLILAIVRESRVGAAQ